MHARQLITLPQHARAVVGKREQDKKIVKLHFNFEWSAKTTFKKKKLRGQYLIFPKTSGCSFDNGRMRSARLMRLVQKVKTMHDQFTSDSTRR